MAGGEARGVNPTEFTPALWGQQAIGYCRGGGRVGGKFTELISVGPIQSYAS